MAPDLPFHLGCPAWSIPEWRGNFLPAKARAQDFLALYARVFNTVEGNSTFYGLPSLETAARWTDEVETGFQFCFKVPRDISHGPGLLARPDDLSQFRRVLGVFAKSATLGPAFLQLHACFGPDRLPELAAFCDAWPSQEFPLAVEVRHPQFFDGGDDEQRLDDFLRDRSLDRVIFDSGALYQSPPDDPVEAASQTRKPRLPVRWHATGRRPFLRLVGRNRVERSDPWLRAAAAAAAAWIRDGLHPYLFMHAPDDVHAPTMCRRFYACLRSELAQLPELDFDAVADPQMELFD